MSIPTSDTSVYHETVFPDGISQSNVYKIVIPYKTEESDNEKTKAVVGTVSGTSISFGSEATITTNTLGESSTTFDSNLNKVVTFYKDTTNNYGTAAVGTVSGTSISFGTPVVFESAQSSLYQQSSCFDTSSNKTVVVYTDVGNSSHGTAIVGTVSGTSISFGTAVVFHAAGTANSVCAFDTTNNKVVIAYEDTADSEKGKSLVGTVSGTSISYGSEVEFESGGIQEVGITFDPDAGKAVVVYMDKGNSNYGTYAVGTVSGTSITYATPVVFAAATSERCTATYDTNSDKVVIGFEDGGNSNYGTSVVLQVGSTNSSDFAGITNQAINNSASGEVVVEGGVITNSALLPFAYTGTTGSSAVFESASSNSFGICFDSSNNKVVVTYDDEGNSSYGTAVVGTVSGTSISWGTPVVFNSGNINGSNCWTAFDSNVNKTVTIFRDNGNSEYGTAIVGTVSGTSISFGTKAVYNSASAYATASDICFDSTQNKLLICYRDVGNSHYGTAIVGTISGTSISFGTEVVFDSTQVEMIGCVHDPSTGKNVVANKEGSGNNGVAQVATISGTSVSFGSQATFNSTSTYYINAVYDSNSNKVVLCYENNGGGNLGQAKVCTISGTSISFGTAATFSEAGDAVNWVTAGFDSNQNRVVVATVATGQTISRFNSGAVSGTDITFGTPQTFLSGNAYPLGQRIVFDTSQNTNVWVYKDNANSQYGTGIAMQLSGANPTLTVGSTYYVQDDGTLSTTSSSVTAGKAIANTTLLLKG